MADGTELGRIALKKAVVRPELTARQAWVLAPEGHSSKPVARLESAGFEVRSTDDGQTIVEEIAHGKTDLLLLSDACDEHLLKQVATQSRATNGGAYLAMVLFATGARNPRASAVMAYALDTDGMTSSADEQMRFKEVVLRSCTQRAPLDRLGLLPSKLAQRIDHLCAQMDRLDHFDLLGVPHDVDFGALQARFHTLAMELHPDRHTRLKTVHPDGFARVKRLYKRMAEAYQVLANDDLRQAYRLGLGHDTASPTQRPASGRLRKELAMCETEEGRRAIMESIEARNFGDWAGAEEALLKATVSEPENGQLAQVLDTVRKLKRLIER